MGFEVILAVGKVHTRGFLKDDAKWFQVMAHVDLCKPGYDSEVYKLTASDKADPVYCFAPMGDGDTEVTEDRYGSKINPMPIPKMLEALRSDNEKDPYRRFEWAIALLEVMKDDTEELECFLWGY